MEFSVSSRAGSPLRGTAGRVGRSLFFGVFLGMGLLFLGLLSFTMLDGAKTLLWKSVPATMLESGIEPTTGAWESRKS